MAPPLLIGTRNPGKLIEIKAIIGELPFEFHSLDEFKDVAAALDWKLARSAGRQVSFPLGMLVRMRQMMSDESCFLQNSLRPTAMIAERGLFVWSQ